MTKVVTPRRPIFTPSPLDAMPVTVIATMSGTTVIRMALIQIAPTASAKGTTDSQAPP